MPINLFASTIRLDYQTYYRNLIYVSRLKFDWHLLPSSKCFRCVKQKKRSFRHLFFKYCAYNNNNRWIFFNHRKLECTSNKPNGLWIIMWNYWKRFAFMGKVRWDCVIRNSTRTEKYKLFLHMKALQ